MNPLGVSTKAAKEAIGCGHTKLYDLINAGELETYTIGRARRVTTASIQRYVERQMQCQAA